MYIYPYIPYLKVPWILDIYISYVSKVSLDVLLWRNDSVCSFVHRRIVCRNVCVSTYMMCMNTLNIRHIYIIYVSNISRDVLLWKNESCGGMYVCMSYLWIPWILDIIVLYISNISRDVLLWRKSPECSFVEIRIVLRCVCISYLWGFWILDKFVSNMYSISLTYLVLFFCGEIIPNVRSWKYELCCGKYMGIHVYHIDEGIEY